MKRLNPTCSLLMICLFCLMSSSQGQSLINSHAQITGELGDTSIVTKTQAAYLKLNFKNGIFTLNMHTDAFSSEIDSINQLIQAINMPLSFVGSLGLDEIKIIESEHDEEFLPVTGTVTIGNKSRELVGKYKLFKLGNDRESSEENIRMTFQVELNLADFGYNPMGGKLKRFITFTIPEGKINKVNEG